MADAGTLATTAQVLLAIGENASANQVLEANTNIWILFAESDMEWEAKKINLVDNFSAMDEEDKQFLSLMASHRAAFYAINQNQNSWQLATTQSKLNVCNSIWKRGIPRLAAMDL